MCAYAKSKYEPRPTDKIDVLNQYLWGNRHVQYNNSKMTSVSLYFQSFIKEGILRVKDLKIKDGNIDEYFLYENIKDKRDIFKEILLLKKALKKFRVVLMDHNPSTTNIVDFMEDDKCSKTGTKFYYKSLIDQKREKPKSEDRIKKRLSIHNIDFESVYTNKITHIKDLKIAEFNYKVLHNILPCNKNLKIWGKQLSM